MTVAELIEELKKLDQDALVYYVYDEGTMFDLLKKSPFRAADIWQDKNNSTAAVILDV